MSDNIKPELMKLLGITDEKVADKVLHYAKLVNDGTTTMLVNSDGKKQAQKLIDDLKANDYAIAKALNERVTTIFELFAHSDHLVHISKGSRTINWSVTASAGGISTGHFFLHNQVHLDTRRLYEDFLSFLDIEIAKATTNVYVKTGINVGSKYKGRFGTEIDSFPS